MKLKRRSKRVTGQYHDQINIEDNCGDESFQSTAGTKKLDLYLEKLLSEKRISAGKKMLPLLVEALTSGSELKFVENNFDPILSICRRFVRRGTSMERQLASTALGLLAMTVDSRAYVHELYGTSLPDLSERLKYSGTETMKILDCMAMITFFGAKYSEDTEKAMKIIWTFMDADSDDDEVASKHSAAALTTAISAWSLLLTTMPKWRLSHEDWQGAISFFLTLLEEHDESVHIAAAEALALIFEIECLKKFSTSVNSSNCKEDRALMEQADKEDLKDTILEELKAWGEASAKEDTTANLDVQDYFENGTCPETVIGEDGIELYTWSQIIRMKFLKRLLGEERLEKHMVENEFLHYIFSLRPTSFRYSRVRLYIPIREEATVQVFQPDVLRQTISRSEKQKQKRMIMSPNSLLDKKRTQLRNKQRLLSEDCNIGHFMVDDGF